MTDYAPLLRSAGILGGVSLLVVVAVGFATRERAPSLPLDVKVPALSSVAETGRDIFDANCAACHGVNAAGSEQGPPLVHDIYNAGHHGDAAFVSAVRRGARQHHWQFGDMPARPGVTDAQVVAIVRYVRELQDANGIVARRHTM